MALTRSGAPAPTSSVSNAQALANRSFGNGFFLPNLKRLQTLTLN